MINALFQYLFLPIPQFSVKRQKYKEDFSVQFNEESPYDVSAINKYFSKFDGVVNGEESRKYGIVNSSDGLLLLIVLLMDKVESEAYKWVLE